MPLLLLDLDNTLVDRDAAFRTAVTDFLAQHGLPETEPGIFEAAAAAVGMPLPSAWVIGDSPHGDIARAHGR